MPAFSCHRLLGAERGVALPLRSGSDPGTNLYDKRGLLVKLEVEVSKCRRYHRHMCVAVLRPERPQTDLPKGATAETTPTTLSVSIDKEGKTYLDAAPIDDAGLRARVRAARASDPETRAVIAADGRAAHKHVVHVMDLLRREDVTKFAINVDPEDVGAPLPNPLPASRGEGIGQ